jgi:hypothetical protein
LHRYNEAINMEAIPRANFGRSLILDRADDLTFSLRSALWPGNDALGMAVQVEPSVTHSLKAPDFYPWILNVIS